jgi:CheY-like chemotaxis protein/HPt (histidine-containing phosphotransfer) domain-containing protein
MMGGSINVASEPGAGSKFRFTARFGLQPSAADRTQTPLRPRTGEPALVVVGNALNREILEDQLSAGNIQVRHAQTGLAALGALRTAALHKKPFELVIIDHSLPDMTGVELAHAIKTASKGVQQQIILLTSFDQDIGQVAEGALRCLTKPIRQSALWECIGVSAKPVPAIASAPETPAAEQPGTGRAPVLIVEDSPVNLEVAVAILDSMGCLVETAVNGRHALDRHARGEYSLIFMDCQMPEMDGFEATVEIRRREALSGRHTPIVALTASVVEDGRRRCLAVGMDDYLAKPFTLEQMRAMLTTWLGPPERPAAREHLSLVTPAAAAPDPIDEQVLASLGRLQSEGRPDIVRQLIELFFKGAAGLLMDLDNGVATGDAALLYCASHALKSASANLGAVVLSTHCKELEALSKSGTVTDAARLVKVIREDYSTVEARLSDRLPRVA